MPETKWSLFSNGMVGFHLTIHPQTLPPEARFSRQFLAHGLTLTDKDQESLLSGRKQGIDTLKGMTDTLMPWFNPDTRLKIATQIADALLNKSIEAQLSREAPTALDQLHNREEALKTIFQEAVPPGALRASAPTLLNQTPVGLSLTVYF